MNRIPPRLYCIVAQRANVAVVIRRGPSQWWHILRWHLESGELEPGAWVRKHLYPRRCDLSENGALFLYYLSGGFEHNYNIFGGISTVPWLYSHVHWREINTHSRGECFLVHGLKHAWGDVIKHPIGDAEILTRMNDNTNFRNELRRGWSYSPGCPPRDPGDTWDERRVITLEKVYGSFTLSMTSEPRNADPSAVEGFAPTYELRSPRGTEPLADVAWADFDHSGRLLIASRTGTLRIESLDTQGQRSVFIEHDLNGLTPNPQPAPEWAMRTP